MNHVREWVGYGLGALTGVKGGDVHTSPDGNKWVLFGGYVVNVHDLTRHNPGVCGIRWIANQHDGAAASWLIATFGDRWLHRSGSGLPLSDALNGAPSPEHKPFIFSPDTGAGRAITDEELAHLAAQKVGLSGDSVAGSHRLVDLVRRGGEFSIGGNYVVRGVL